MKIKVVERKLGREKAWGLAYDDESKIEIDPNQNPRHYLKIVIHECLHVVMPELTEQDVVKHAKSISDVLWKMKYRRIRE